MFGIRRLPLKNTALSVNAPAGRDVVRAADPKTTLDVMVFVTSAETLWHYAKWVQGSHPYDSVVVEACLLNQPPGHQADIVAELTELGFDPGNIHVLQDDGVRDPDVYVDPDDGGIGAEGAYAVPGLGHKQLYLFDNISVTDAGKPVEEKLYGLMRLLAGIPKQGGLAVLFDEGADRVCFSHHCISTLSSEERDAVIREALEDLRFPERVHRSLGARHG